MKYTVVLRIVQPVKIVVAKPDRVIVAEQGMVQLPRILTASKPEFGWAAATAVKRWLFEPPMKAGKPVNARLVMPFDFKAPSMATKQLPMPALPTTNQPDGLTKPLKN
ncbi:MAG: hypothetical protein HOO93_04210 [Methyloglobulus sp.]|nr:hypothetical protein [Methyloglobulus sp.]